MSFHMFSWVLDPNITQFCALNVSGRKHVFPVQNGSRNDSEMFETCKYFRIWRLLHDK